jgi:hypothetical protein
VKRDGKKPPLRIGVLGVTRLDPLFLKSGPERSSLGIVPPGPALARFLPEVRKNADVIVVLAALQEDDARALARDLPGIDFIFGTYAGFTSSKETVEGTTRILYVGTMGKLLGEIRLFLDGSRISRAIPYLHNLSARYPDDPGWLGFMNEVAGRLAPARRRRQKAQEVRTQAAQAPFAGPDACAKCHVGEHAQWLGTAHARSHRTLVEKKKEGRRRAWPAT